jgi:enoyl-CoA hydratase/carnithine racemase
VTTLPSFPDVAVLRTGHIVEVEIQRPPHNYFDQKLIAQLAEIFEAVDEDAQSRVIVLRAQGKSFCAGANFNDGSGQDIIGGKPQRHLYDEALRLFATRKPIVGAIHGNAIGGGLGVALVPDFRVGCPQTRFAANFTLLGIHAGFGISHTLPALIGQQQANLMLYTGRRINGEQAFAMGLLDVLVPAEQLREAALQLAGEIAAAAPLGVMATRATARIGLVERVGAAMQREKELQGQLYLTEDFHEGIASTAERRKPHFNGS